MAVLASLCASRGTFQGKQIFSRPEVLDQMIETRKDYSPDLFMKYPVRFTRGFAALTPQQHDHDAYGWGGAGEV
jgi:hypothetical protein